jgi:hypothetical protein
VAFTAEIDQRLASPSEALDALRKPRMSYSASAAWTAAPGCFLVQPAPATRVAWQWDGWSRPGSGRPARRCEWWWRRPPFPGLFADTRITSRSGYSCGRPRFDGGRRPRGISAAAARHAQGSGGCQQAIEPALPGNGIHPPALGAAIAAVDRPTRPIVHHGTPYPAQVVERLPNGTHN